MGDVCERTAVHERSRSFERLHEIGPKRVPEQRGHRPRGLEVDRGHRMPVAPVADDHAAEAGFKIREIGGETERRHRLRRDRDVEPLLARKPVARAAEADDSLAQRPVVQVERAAPGDAALIDAERVAPVHMIVDHRGQQVVGGRDRVEVSGEMEIDRVHRHDLGVAASGGAALHAEARAERRLAQADHRFLADAIQRIAEADGGGRLAFARRRGADRGDEDQFSVGPIREPREKRRLELGDMAAVRIKRILGDPDPRRDFCDRPQMCGARDFDIGKHALVSPRGSSSRRDRPICDDLQGRTRCPVARSAC